MIGGVRRPRHPQWRAGRAGKLRELPCARRLRDRDNESSHPRGGSAGYSRLVDAGAAAAGRAAERMDAPRDSRPRA